jgi:hypothetical protein
MKKGFGIKFVKAGRAGYFGFLGATAIIHITPLVKSIFKDFESRYFSERHDEFETAVLLSIGFLALIMEPVTYIVNLAVCLEKHGYIAFLWLAPVAVCQAYAIFKWFSNKRTKRL